MTSAHLHKLFLIQEEGQLLLPTALHAAGSRTAHPWVRAVRNPTAELVQEVRLRKVGFVKGS